MLVQLAASGDARALDELFTTYRARLKQMVHLRINRKLQGRIDDSDVIQESFMEAARKLKDYALNPILPFYLWLRHLTGLKLVELHRKHLGTQMRDASLEVSLHGGGPPDTETGPMANYLLSGFSSISSAAIKIEERLALQKALNIMTPGDRDIIAMKHFEQLTLDEIAQVRGISRSAAGRNYLAAMRELRQVLQGFPEFKL